MKPIVHIPLKHKGFSGPVNCHLLWQNNNIFIMDNHRMALWSWMQILKDQTQTPINFLHLDAHYDTGPVETTSALHENLTLNDYLNLKNSRGEALVQWDNYLTYFFQVYKSRITNAVAFTQKIGIPYPFDNEYELHDLLKQSDMFFDHSDPWIVNLDFDYFYGRQLKNSPMVHEKFMRDFFQILKNGYDENKILALTCALSPECCGSWQNSQLILDIFCDIFKLPPFIVEKQ